MKDFLPVNDAKNQQPNHSMMARPCATASSLVSDVPFSASTKAAIASYVSTKEV